MRPRRRSEPESLGKGFVLYLDDVEALRAVLAYDDAHVELHTDEVELANVAELKRVSTVQELDLTRRDDPHVSVWFRGYGARIHTWEDDIRSRGMASDVRSILDKCRGRRFLSPGMIWLVLAIVAAYAVAGALLVWADFFWGWPLAAALNVVLWLGWLYSLDHFGFKLIPHYRHEHTTFWSRNKDTLIVQGVLLIPTNVVTALIVYFVTRD
jgi:hypothetical protein